MDRDIYDKKWKLGPYAKKKEEFKQQGKLDKYGRIVDKTPEAWKMLFGDSDKPTTVNEVAAALGKKVPEVTNGNAEESDDEKEKKRDKKKKDKKDKKEKKAKKSKKADSESED